MEAQPVIRSAVPNDFSCIVDLERSCPTAAHWSEQQYLDALADSGRRSRLVLAVEQQPTLSGIGKLVGFLIARHLASEWELENIVVAPQARGKGIGTLLMQKLLDRAQQANGDVIFLEVRESNATARHLYAKVGFTQTGRRKAYYTDPSEDAVLYSKRLV